MSTSTLRIVFTTTTVSDHRICWRVDSGTYDCTTVVSCPTIGVYTSDITIPTLDNETCDDVIVDGYVQPTCYTEASTSGQVSFTSTFDPEPADCVGYLVSCNEVGIESTTITDVGSGYATGTPLTIAASGTGTGYDIQGIIGNGGIKTWTITSGGTGYNGGASATFNNVPPVVLTGSGTGGLFDVTITSGVITSIALTSSNITPGAGFAISDTFEFSNTLLGSSGSGGVITVNTVNTGELQYISVVNFGSGFVAQSLLTIPAPSSGTTATATAIMKDCDKFNYVDCSTATTPSLSMELGQSAVLCDNDAVGGLIDSLMTGYLATKYGCCYACSTIRFNPGSSIDLYYISKLGVVTKQILTTQTDIELIDDSYWYSPTDASVVITDIGACT